MADEKQLWINEYQLILFEKDRLVKIRKNQGQPHISEPVELPSWTVRSRNTIWLTEENVPIQIRASRGEKIKQEILRQNRIRVS